MQQTIVIALGGNAIQNKGEKGTYEEAYANVYHTMQGILPLLLDPDKQVVITHGNGPQVGTLLIQQNAARDLVPAQPMFVCGAMTQGMIGYLIQQSLLNLLQEKKISRPVASIVTQVVVDASDPGFQKPSKPVGPFYTPEDVEKMKNLHPDYVFKEDAGRGFRRVVASPKPLDIVEIESVRALLNAGTLVITSGGGGIPVSIVDEQLTGVDAVIDKDRAGALLADKLNASLFLILTSVDQVALNFGKPDEQWLSSLSVEECRKYLALGHFADGSMGPKIEAALEFVRMNETREAVITSPAKLTEALKHEQGTWIYL